MNLSLITSFAVGGLVLLSILTLNRNMMLHSAETTVHLTNQYQHDEMFRLISHDISRIGYSPNPAQATEIEEFGNDKIEFKADVMDEGIAEVKWKLFDTPVTQTPNPNDKLLRRIGSVGSGTLNSLQTDFSVIDFNLTGFRDTEGKIETSDKDQIKSILIEIVYEAPVPTNSRYASQDDYDRKYWRKFIVPKNLQFQQL